MRKSLRLLPAVLCLLLSLGVARTMAQQGGAAASPTPAPASVTQAMRSEANDFYQRQEWERAAKAYETISLIEPQNAGALNRLGLSLHTLKQYAGAIEAYKRALDVSPQAATMYNLACSYALSNERAQALAWLDKAVQAGFNQPDQMGKDEDLAALRDDAQFRALIARAQANAKPCAANPLNRQFDFWVGEWNVLNPQGQAAGQSSVQLILGDCVVFENWSGAGGFNGKSFNFYNAGKGLWQQTWVDDRGGMLEFFGGYKDGQLRYRGESQAPGGGKILHRLTFFNIATDRVRQLWEQSTDGGKTWTTAFDGMYVRKR